MAHKTLISGTARSVTGGRDLIAGTGYAKKQGKTLIDGTVYKLGFRHSCIIEITAVNANSLATVTINGTTYNAAATLEVESGTEIECIAEGGRNTSGKITVDGNVVAQGSWSNVDANYTYLGERDTQIYLNGAVVGRVSEINITTK